jgi:hypothetical protein
MNKDSINEMLNTSLEDYKEFETKGKLSRLRDGANKLLGVLEEYTAYKTGHIFEDYRDFRRTFLDSRVRLSLDQKRDLLNDIRSLHIFFYYGLIEGETVDNIKYIYTKSYRLVK